MQVGWMTVKMSNTWKNFFLKMWIFFLEFMDFWKKCALEFFDFLKLCNFILNFLKKKLISGRYFLEFLKKQKLCNFLEFWKKYSTMFWKLKKMCIFFWNLWNFEKNVHFDFLNCAILFLIFKKRFFWFLNFNYLNFFLSI